MWQAAKKQLKRFVRPGYINYIDVGAAGPLQNPWKRHQSKIKIWLQFEPNDDGIRRDENKISVDAAIWHKNEEREFYVIGAKGYGSSLLEPNFEYVRENYEELRHHGNPKMAETWFDRTVIQETHTLTTRSLDDVLDELGQHDLYHFLKIDVQGADYYVLKGAERLLSGSCIGIQTEQFIYPLYKDSVLLDETTEYLSEFGFELVKKFPAHGTFDSQHDCLYLKTGIDNHVSRSIRTMYEID